MKKSIFKGMFALAFLVAAGYGVKLAKNHTRLSYLALENVEALASSSEGTDAGFCFLEQAFYGEYSYQSFCDKETSDSKIYPCPSSQSWGNYLKSAQDRCTK